MKRFIAAMVALFVFTGVCHSAPPKLDESTYPRVDGSTSTQALQCLIKSTILGKDVVVPHTDTGKSFMNLIEGTTDLILVARVPSREEIARGAKKGVRLEAKPVALDALVFIVNKGNGVEDLTTTQIRQIYEYKIRRWEKLDVPSAPTGEIQAHRRARFSGSEELMGSLVMNEPPYHMSPPRAIANEFPLLPPAYQVIGPMGMSMHTIADKRLGLTYSVYYYVKNAQKLVDVKEKSLEALKRHHLARLKALEESDLQKRDRAYWADLRKREPQRFSQAEEQVRRGLEDTRKALSGVDEIKMIKVDGVEPTADTIGSRRYPHVAEVYAVIRDNEPKDGPVVKLRDWLLTAEGQKAVAESGFVAMKPRTPATAAAQRSAAAQTESLTADNVAHSIGNNKWNWTIFLKGDKRTIDAIKCVEYTLHPSFPHPVRQVCEKGDPKRCFELSSTGWGTFKVGIHVHMKDGSSKNLEHQLKF